MILFIVIVNVLNLVGAVVMVTFLVKRAYPAITGKQDRLQLVAKYVRFFIVYALMANRFNRYHVWLMGHDINTAIPFWPPTPQELVIIALYLGVVVTTFVAPRYIQKKWGERRPPSIRKYYGEPLLPAYAIRIYMYERAKTPLSKRHTYLATSFLINIICWLGVLNVLFTLVFALKNVWRSHRLLGNSARRAWFLS